MLLNNALLFFGAGLGACLFIKLFTRFQYFLNFGRNSLGFWQTSFKPNKQANLNFFFKCLLITIFCQFCFEKIINTKNIHKTNKKPTKTNHSQHSNQLMRSLVGSCVACGVCCACCCCSGMLPASSLRFRGWNAPIFLLNNYFRIK